jgi:hypothetical protein
VIPEQINTRPVVAYVPHSAIDGHDPEAGVAICSLDNGYVVWSVWRVPGRKGWDAANGSYFVVGRDPDSRAEAFDRAAKVLARRAVGVRVR